MLFVHVTFVGEADGEFADRIKALHERVKPGRILGIQCVENSTPTASLPRCTIEQKDVDVTIVTLNCTGRNVGLGSHDPLDNEALLSILKWYDYDLRPVEEEDDESKTAAYPFAKRSFFRRLWRSWSCKKGT